MAEDVDHYQLLGVQRDTSYQAIKRQYQELIRRVWLSKQKEHHPDKLGPDATPTQRSEATELFRKLTDAYHTLSDDVTRKSYDSHMTANQISHDCIINDTLNLSEMSHERRKEGRVYWTSCRCGGTYEIEDDEIKGCVQDGCGLIVGCNTCSLHIKVTILNS